MLPLLLTSLVAAEIPLVPLLLTPWPHWKTCGSLFFTLSKAHSRYLHWVRAFLRCSFSCLSNSGLLHTVLALWERVLITLNLAERLWWLSHCKYWSVWVGFLYTVMDRLPFSSGFTMVSKKGMEPSSLLSSTVNFMAGSTLLMCCRKSCLLTSLWMTKVSSTNLCQNLGGGMQCLGLFALSTPLKVCYYGTFQGAHGHTLNLFKELAFEGEICVFRQNSNRRIMSFTPMTFLSLRVGSFSNRSFIIFKAGSIGTNVKRADTS